MPHAALLCAGLFAELGVTNFPPTFSPEDLPQFQNPPEGPADFDIAFDSQDNDSDYVP
jgi:hypothetical protein